MDAIKAALLSGRTEVIDADLSGYFDSMEFGRLGRLLARRITDPRALRLIGA